jgi:hypothetical protein
MPRYAIISGIARSPHSLQQDRLELAHAELEERVYPGTFANVLVGNEEHWIIQFGYGPKHAHEVGVRGGIDRGQGRETGACRRRHSRGRCQPAREANQDRRKGGEPRALRDLPDGRGRGAAADVGRHSIADRPVACAARARMTSARPSAPDRQGERYVPRYNQIGRVSALRCRRPPASIAFCPRRRPFALLKPARGVILARNRPESGECRFNRGRDLPRHAATGCTSREI